MTFRYRNVPLERPGEQIRILRLLDTSDDGMDIQVQLLAHDLDECPPYVAISYTWGDRLPTFPISVNSQRFLVRMNCLYALWQMKYQNIHTHFWIDSVCIDQDSIKEKNLQVAMMGTIYSKAFMTASCLGSGNHLAVLANPELSSADREVALERLHQKEYWSRMWIKQEIILSKDVRLFCGVECLNWDSYEDIVKSIVNTSRRQDCDQSLDLEDQETTPEETHTTLGQDRLRLRASVFQEDRDSNPSTELWRLLEKYGDSECHDPRDKIYALLSLLPESGRATLDLPVDYECELAGLWLKLVRSCLSEWLATPERSQPECRGISLTFWVVMQRMAQHWFRLKLDKPGVRAFISQWHDETKVNTAGAEPVKIMHTMQHIPILVKSKLRLSEYRNRRNMFQMSAFAWLSAAMPASEVGPWLEEKQLYDLAPDPACYPTDRSQQAMCPFTLSGMPSDARVKVLIAKVTENHRPSAFLVPAFVELGDHLLGCDMLEHVDTVWQTPIVRFKESGKTVTGRESRSVLIGWALQLQSDGKLQDDLDYPIRAGGLREHSSYVFNLHYEDLMLQALLKQDSLAYLTHPRTHPTHPSFLTELVPTRTNDKYASSDEEDDMSLI